MAACRNILASPKYSRAVPPAGATPYIGGFNISSLSQRNCTSLYVVQLPECAQTEQQISDGPALPRMAHLAFKSACLVNPNRRAAAPRARAKIVTTACLQ